MEQNTQVLCVNWGGSVPTTPRWMLHLPTAQYGCGAAIIPSSVDVPVNSIAQLCSFWRITCWLIKQCVCNIRIALLQMASSPTLQRWGSYSLLYTTATSCMLHAACTCLEMSCGREKVVSLASHKNCEISPAQESPCRRFVSLPPQSLASFFCRTNGDDLWQQDGQQNYMGIVMLGFSNCLFDAPGSGL